MVDLGKEYSSFYEEGCLVNFGRIFLCKHEVSLCSRLDSPRMPSDIEIFCGRTSKGENKIGIFVLDVYQPLVSRYILDDSNVPRRLLIDGKG